MKSFWKTVLAVIVGSIFTAIIGWTIMMFFISIISAIGSAAGSSSVPSNGILKIDMAKIVLSEQSTNADPTSALSMVRGEEVATPVGLLESIQAIEKAAEDPGVKYIYLLPDGAQGGMAGFEEFRKAIVKFRESGKPVIAFTENPGNASYYLASAADKIYMSSYAGGMNTLVGLSSQMFFLKDILDRLGVNVQLIRHGKYKSAGEMYIKNDISPENRLQYETLIGSIWSSWSKTMAEARGITAEEFNGMIDNLELNSPEDFLSHGLVDSLYTRQQLEDQLCALYGTGKISNVKEIAFSDYVAANSVATSKSKKKIAIIYADGEIVDGKAKQEVAGDRFASLIAKVRKDSTIKAVVFRVNSPGGSVVASDKIKTEIDLMRECKPVIASYGDYAASGGYWISNSCDKIFCDESTLTGSIGVFSMIPDLSNTVKDLAHVKVVNINSNKHGDMYSLMKPLDSNELEYMQASVEDIYDRFTSIVAEGRDMDKDFVDSIAQGRVWAGNDALEIGLVDQIGTLQDAILYAAEVIDSGDDYATISYPKPQTTWEMIIESISGTSEETIFSGTPFEGIANAFKDIEVTQAGKAYARLPYGITIK